jgi:hypothetical protein
MDFFIESIRSCVVTIPIKLCTIRVIPHDTVATVQIRIYVHEKTREA